MKNPRKLLLVLLLISGTVCSKEKPNIIYIMADDLGYADLSGYGRKDFQTPNLDKLASLGVKFINAYAAAAVCTPTRTAFMTGRYPARTPVGLMEPLRWGHKDSLVGLTPDYVSIASQLQNIGYKTFLVGKWHLGYKPDFSPGKNGFDYFFGFKSGGTDYVTHTNPKGQNDLYENDIPIKRDGYLTNLLAAKSIEIIKANHDKPFFLSIQFNAPHWPWQGPGDPPYPDTLNWHKGGNAQKFAAMVKSMDDAIGKIMQALEDEHIAQNTLVIFTSDNGGEEFSDMGNYAGMKETLLEGGIRVPAFICWPGKIPVNSVTDQMAITMDWTATILAVAGSHPVQKFPPDGINLLPILTGKLKNRERTFYWRLFQENYQKAIRDGKWKYLSYQKGEFLFDLAADPGEQNDLKEMFPEKFIQLKQKFQVWEAGVLKPVPLR
jgi:arylsulfatase A-like enzyme